MAGDTAIPILRRLVAGRTGGLSPAAAAAVLQLGFAEADQARMSELAAKSNRGALSPQEADEYDGYIAAADLLSLWQSAARLSLKQHPSAA